MSYLFLDIETIGSQSEAVRDRISKTITPPGSMKKQETIDTWYKEKFPAVVDEAVAKTSFDGGKGHVVCIGFAGDEGDGETYSADTLLQEQYMLESFAFVLREFELPPIIVGHYVEFDIRFLWQRAICLGVKLPSWFPKDPKPWSNEVYDTMFKWCGAKGSIKLDELCFNLGIEGKGDVDGSMVAQMWLDGKHDEIASYCLDDVHKVRAIHQKMAAAGM